MAATTARQETGVVYYGPHDRCSEADRDIIAERLRTAHVDGRLTIDELGERLDATLSARTYGDLERQIRDLVPQA